MGRKKLFITAAVVCAAFVCFMFIYDVFLSGPKTAETEDLKDLYVWDSYTGNIINTYFSECLPEKELVNRYQGKYHYRLWGGLEFPGFYVMIRMSGMQLHDFGQMIMSMPVREIYQLGNTEYYILSEEMRENIEEKLNDPVHDGKKLDYCFIINDPDTKTVTEYVIYTDDPNNPIDEDFIDILKYMLVVFGQGEKKL